jgi:hypothetical protein
METGLFDGGGRAHELRTHSQPQGRRPELGGVVCATNSEKDAWVLKKEIVPGRDRGKTKQEKEVKTESSHFLVSARIKDRLVAIS